MPVFLLKVDTIFSQIMHLENRDLEIWYEPFQNKMRLFIKGCY